MNTINFSGNSGFGEPLSLQIYKHILKKIIEGEFKAGDKIVEEDISKELNTSRAPVREALYLLQVDGIVERMPRRGTVVKSFTKSEIEEYNDVIIELIRVAVNYLSNKWNEEHKLKFKEYFNEVSTEYEKKNVIEYQIKLEQLLRYILSIANNKALIRFYEEANSILKVFAQVQWTIKTMENFHCKLKDFGAAMLESDFAKANKAIYETIKLGVK
ncbi:GntR family transcriptional regulator [Lysinibacillus telephonicus]|uniref:GntR family transcriptional regulator n=1 Tax=Lysinibacillus telephonicus TaxID=1714840 RepID=UPI00397CB299